MVSFDEHSQRMEYAYGLIKNTLEPDSLDYLMETRAYFHNQQRDLLNEIGVYQSSKPLDVTLKERELLEKLGFYSMNGYYLLDNRFIIPVYSASGKLITLIGWYNDFKKYITIPSPHFSKDVDYFNIDHALKLSFEKYNGLVFLVEGIFDAYSLRAIGLPAVSTMGVTVSASKGELLKIFNKVVALPDNDKVGKKAIHGYRAWQLPYNSTFLDIRGTVDFGEDSKFKIKDADNLVSWFDPDGVKDLLLDVGQSKDKFVVLNL